MKFGKKVSVELKGDAEEAFNALNKVVGHQKETGVITSEEITLLNGIQRAFDLMEDNPFYGRNAKKKQIPHYYATRYNASNLFIVNLPQFWRMIYTLESNKIEIIAFVLDIFTHKEYDKRFGYRKK
jgi:hypothetical protein